MCSFVVRPHRNAYVDAAYCYRQSSLVCRSVMVVSPAKTAEPIEVPSGLWTRVGKRKHMWIGSAQWRHLANTTEPSTCGGDAAFLSNYFDHWLLLLGHYLTHQTGEWARDARRNNGC